MIYIDPPYNTGKEFIYPDKYSETLDTYLEYTGQKDSEGRKFSTNTEVQGRFHSRWLNMMYPRLYLARNLLREDGVIFISIDDNEITNLRELCDEIFGEENFFCQVIIRANSRGQTFKQIAKTHEYLLVYTKNFETELFELEKTGDKDDLNLEDDIGRFNIRELRNRNPKFGKHNRPNLFYAFYVDPKTADSEGFFPVSLNQTDKFSVKVEPFNSSGKESCWRWGKQRAQINISSETLKSNLVGKQKQDGSFQIFEKYRKSTFKPKSIWDDNCFLNETGTVEVGSLGLKDAFDFPKPIQLVQQCIRLSCEPDDIVLDFFAGSSTTAHAVMELNKEDGGRRNFVLVQLPEPTDKESAAFKSGYRSIADVSKERIRRVSKNITEEKQGQLNLNENFEIDSGFKVFKLDQSNFKVWEGNVEKIGNLAEQLSLHVDHVGKKSTPEDILHELLLKAGFPLTTKIKKEKMANKDVFSVEDGAMLICLEKEITSELIDALADAEPLQVICLDEAFKGNDQLKTNAVQTFKARAQIKESEIVFRTV